MSKQYIEKIFQGCFATGFVEGGVVSVESVCDDDGREIINLKFIEDLRMQWEHELQTADMSPDKSED